MESAETRAREAVQQQRYAAEQQERQQQTQQVPAHVEEWLNRHPQYLDPRDAVAQAELNLATMKAVRDGKTWNDSDFIESIERHLGLRQQAQPQPNGNGSQQPAPSAPVQRQAASARQQYVGPPVSAPVRRDPPSMTTGRPQSEPARLTSEEAQLARSLGLSPEEYALQKQKMHNLKQAGVIIDGR